MAKYTPPEIDKMLSSITILYDTRERDTPALRKRLDALGRPYRRCKLDYGDYSAEWVGIDSSPLSAAQIACVERKMGLDELATCFSAERKRFQKEFERTKADGCHVHLLVENDNYEKLYAQNYRSKVMPQAIMASWLTWSIRYGITLHFCKPETTPKLIVDILRYEIREWLLNQ